MLKHTGGICLFVCFLAATQAAPLVYSAKAFAGQVVDAVNKSRFLLCLEPDLCQEIDSLVETANKIYLAARNYLVDSYDCARDRDDYLNKWCVQLCPTFAELDNWEKYVLNKPPGIFGRLEAFESEVVKVVKKSKLVSNLSQEKQVCLKRTLPATDSLNETAAKKMCLTVRKPETDSLIDTANKMFVTARNFLVLHNACARDRAYFHHGDKLVRTSICVSLCPSTGRLGKIWLRDIQTMTDFMTDK